MEQHIHRQSAILLEKLKKKYGASIETSLYNLKTETSYSLSDFSRDFGFSRERARQIFFLFFREPYTSIFKDKIERKKKIKTIQRLLDFLPKKKLDRFKKDSYIYKSAIAEKIIFGLCETIGFRITIPLKRTFDIIVNGYVCDIKSTNNIKLNHGKQSLNFKVTKKQMRGDFIICYVFPTNTSYIIPTKELTSSHIYIQLDKNKYDQYKEAWHLLKQPQQKKEINNFICSKNKSHHIPILE